MSSLSVRFWPLEAMLYGPVPEIGLLMMITIAAGVKGWASGSCCFGIERGLVHRLRLMHFCTKCMYPPSAISVFAFNGYKRMVTQFALPFHIAFLSANPDAAALCRSITFQPDCKESKCE